MSALNVLITGATSGIGQALCTQYKLQGYSVIACGRNQEKLGLLEQSGMNICQFDLNNVDDIASQTADIASLDLLILNAGDCKYIDDAKHFDGQRFEEIISTNLTSLGWQLQYLLPKVKKGGHVVFISSSATIVPFPRSEAYGASKAGMDYLANSLRLDLAKEDINVTLVHPGFIKTPLTDKNDFPMPFLMSAEQAAERIFKGVAKKKRYLHFPKRLTWLLKTFSFLPATWWQAIILKGHNS